MLAIDFSQTQGYVQLEHEGVGRSRLAPHRVQRERGDRVVSGQSGQPIGTDREIRPGATAHCTAGFLKGETLVSPRCSTHCSYRPMRKEEEGFGRPWFRCGLKNGWMLECLCLSRL